MLPSSWKMSIFFCSAGQFCFNLKQRGKVRGDGRTLGKDPGADDRIDDPERTAFTDGWFRTGDLDRRDDAGKFYFVARRKDIIRLRGENVCGAEVDRVPLPHPDVELASAVGVPGEVSDEDVLEAVKLRDGADVLPEQLKAWCAGPRRRSRCHVMCR